MKKIKKGDKVRVVRDGANASDFTIKYKSCVANGVYSVENWRNEDFVVLWNPRRIKFKSSPSVWCAYPLGLNGKLVGYVYNNSIEKL